MHYFNVTETIKATSRRFPEPGAYLGSGKNFDDDTRRWPKLDTGVMVLDTEAKASWETAEIAKLKVRLMRAVNSEMIRRIGSMTVSHGGKTYSLAKQAQVNGLATGESRGIGPAGGRKLTDTAGARNAITVSAMDAIGQLMMDAIDTKNAEEAAHVQAILGEDSLSVLQSYDVKAGWT